MTQVESALSGNEDRYRMIVENTADWIWEIDVHGTTVYSNQRVTAVLGYTPEDLSRMRLEDVVHPADLEKFGQVFSAALVNREGWRNVVLRWRHRDGTYRELESCASPIFAADGSLRGFHGMDRDISERRRTEEALKASEARFGASFDASPLAASIARMSDGRFVAANAKYEKLFGWPGSELIGRTSLEVGLWPDAQARSAWVERLRPGIPMTDYRAAWRRRDGASREVSISSEIIDVGGELHILAFVQDVTEQVQAQERLREQEAMLRQITETIPEVFWIVTPDWREVIYISPAYEAIWGRPAAALYGNGLDWADAVAEDQLPAVLAARPSPDMISRHEVVHFPDYQIRRPDGSLRWISARAYPIVDEKGRTVHFAGIAEDITERKGTESELLAAKKAAEAASADKSRFLAAASHDLRQPMQAITLFASALDRTPLSEEQKRISHGLKRAASALGGLLDSLLDVSRLDAGVIEPHPRWIDLYEIFRQIDDEFAAAALEKDLRFKLYFPDRALSVHTDPELLMGMLRNLVANALAYTERGGVLVSARVRGARLLMQVWDTGIGIDPGNVPLIYDEFFQVDNRHRDRTRGLGLGLSIVRRLAVLMGYELDCRSRPGRGSVFELGIPIDRTRAAHIADQPAGAAAAEVDLDCLKGSRIVLIEDDMPVADSLSLWLESFGVNVLSFTRADDALADAAAAGADFYITDFRLPGSMNGVEFLEAVERRSSTPVKALIVTGDTSASRVSSFRSLRWKVLHKPIEAAKLLSALAGLCAGAEPPPQTPAAP